MKVNMRPVGDYRGEGHVYRFHSVSNPVGWHFCVVFESTCDKCDGSSCMWKPAEGEVWDARHECVPCDACTNGRIYTVECSCTGFQNHKNCWHQEKSIELEKERE